MRNIFFSLSLLLVGCGAADDSATTAPVDLAHPPARPATVSAGERKWFVLDRFELGVSDLNAWRRIGYDLDGRATSREDSQKNKQTICPRVAGSPSAVLQDGDNGIDNSFGQHFMSVVKALMADVEQKTNERIAAGGYTFILRLDNVGADNNASVPGALYLAGPRATAPKFTPDETWPVADLHDMPPLQVFSNGYMTNGVWVSGELGKETIAAGVPFLGDALVTKLVGGVISVRVRDGQLGVIAGAVRSDELLATITPSLMRRGVCPGMPTFGAYATTVQQSADLWVGATSPSECNAMSVGIGFTMKPIKGIEGWTGVPAPATPACDGSAPAD
jgi:hypothetical protein